jgi:hypothetical protein
MREIIDIVEGAVERTYTQQTFDQIARMRAQKLGWDVISQRLGKPAGSLKVQWHKYQTGKWKNSLQKTLDDDAALERDLETKSIAQIAAERGITKQAVLQRAWRLGLDKEMRDELRAEKDKERTFH